MSDLSSLSHLRPPGLAGQHGDEQSSPGQNSDETQDMHREASLLALASLHPVSLEPHIPTDAEPLTSDPAPQGAPPDSLTHLLWGDAEPPPPLPQSPQAPLLDRYDDLGPIGRGGMGEIRRVRDRKLNRTMAMKIVHDTTLNSRTALARFIEEAQTTAQLQHPSIVPVHEIGQLDDGRIYFTMKEVRGRTFSAVIQEVHAASSGQQWRPSTAGWTFRRLIEAFRKVTEAVHYAHTRGVTHRDLKPANIMVGDFGEVLVMDWGLARIRGHLRPDLDPDGSTDATLLGGIVTLRTQDAALATQMGAIAGTPAYMPPEQAMGDIHRLGPPSDVYSLGAILYEILTGRPPYTGPDPMAVLMQVLTGPPPPPLRRAAALSQGDTCDISSSDFTAGAWSDEQSGSRSPLLDASPPEPTLDALPPIGAPVDGTLDAEDPSFLTGLKSSPTPKGNATPPPPPRSTHDRPPPERPEPLQLPVPDALNEICLKAIAREIHDRYPDAGALGEAVQAWLEGSQRREQALRIVATAEELLPEIETLKANAQQFRRDAERLLRDVKTWEPIEKKQPGWQLEDEAQRLERLAVIREVEYVQTLQGALTHVPDLPEAHARLADYYHARHLEAERSRDQKSAAQYEVLLRTHEKGRYAAYLSGVGALTLLTDPPNAQVTFYRFVEQERRLEPQSLHLRQTTPLIEMPLEPGSYLLELRAPGYQTTRYPVSIGRGEHWDGIRPGDQTSTPIRLPLLGELLPEDRYVPGGWFWSGGDPEAFDSLPRRRIWVDGFVMRQHPITNREYLRFLDDLVDQGRESEALDCAPRQRSGPDGSPGTLIYGRDSSGHFLLQPDGDGDLWLPEWPVVMVPWRAGVAYGQWLSTQTQHPWRLPGELEWEKAARGVDGRFFPWGDFGEPTWTTVQDSRKGSSHPSEVTESIRDISVYGIHWLAGNVRTWCWDEYLPLGPELQAHRYEPDPTTPERPDAKRIGRGGCFMLRLVNSRCAARSWGAPNNRSSLVGLRMVRPF